MDKHILAMREMITSFQVTQAIYTAAKLSIADHIKQGTTCCSLLSSLTNTKTEKLYRLLRSLASIGIFFEMPNQNFKLTEKGELLCADHSNSLKHYALMYGEEAYMVWKELPMALTSDSPMFENVYDMPLFEYLENHPDAGLTFNLAMKNSTASYKGKVATHYDFSQFETVADVGGGTGELLIEILESAPNLQTVLYEQAAVIKQAKKMLANFKDFHRIQFISGDFFTSIPSHCDAYIMRHIIHDWPLDQAKQILSNCCQVMDAGSVLLLIEGVIKSTCTKDPLKWIDLHMMVTLNGKERTHAEFTDLLKLCGLKITNIIPLSGSHLSIIEVRRLD